MPIYEIRTNCEYILEIEAENEEEALTKAENTPYDGWYQAWSTYEIEVCLDEEE